VRGPASREVAYLGVGVHVCKVKVGVGFLRPAGGSLASFTFPSLALPCVLLLSRDPLACGSAADGRTAISCRSRFGMARLLAFDLHEGEDPHLLSTTLNAAASY
jgi:hypothetical protein